MDHEHQSTATGAVARWGSWIYLALATVAILWLGLRLGTIPLTLFVSTESWLLDLGIGVAAGAVLAGSWQVGVAFLPSARKVERTVAETIGPLGPGDVFVLALLSGFSEELFFRGAVQSQWGLVTATLLFGLLHLGPGREFRLWTAFALAAGAALGGLMLWRGALLAPVVAHAGVNLVGLARLRKLAATPLRGGS